ncbi:cardiolipin synthase ClsB [Alcanivorax quisquiliarum]|uniref:Cardiolipin synthase B n=1 Tax=Alcanivorax quisquiliarum TaxID=2933565 RepID=A0ABT0E9S3_9GAMM|nr:cardiolipin synthase ClsB [Alcanivorax quisquiliarum]
MTEQWREGNEVRLLTNGEEFFPTVFRSIRSARREVLIETFILFDDEVGQALKEALLRAAHRGARVELLADGYGSADLGAAYVQELTDAGVKVRLFDPQPKLLGVRTNLFRRLHRKIVVVDNKVAFVGGINFSAEHLASFGPMAKQDYAVQVRGPIVEDIRRASLKLLGRRVRRLRRHPFQCIAGDARLRLAIRDNHRHTTDIEVHYLAAIRAARQRIVIANAYFFPGYRLMRALRDAVKRGVNVTLILQGQPDRPWVRVCSQALYGYLLQDGIRIREYCERPLHAKVALVDDEWATVGSSNLDPLSLSLNLEANIIIRDPEFVATLFQELTTLAQEHCQEVQPPQGKRQPRWRTPLTFLCYHFMRHFPTIAARLPARFPRVRLIGDEPQQATTPCEREKSS